MRRNLNKHTPPLHGAVQAKESNWLRQIDEKNPMKRSAKQIKTEKDAALGRDLKIKPVCMKWLGKNHASSCMQKTCPCRADICADQTTVKT